MIFTNAGGYVTIPVPVFIAIFIVTTTGINAGSAMGRVRMDIRDLNGDGYMDLLSSETDGDLRAALGKTGHTNLLKSVSWLR